MTRQAGSHSPLTPAAAHWVTEDQEGVSREGADSSANTHNHAVVYANGQKSRPIRNFSFIDSTESVSNMKMIIYWRTQCQICYHRYPTGIISRHARRYLFHQLFQASCQLFEFHLPMTRPNHVNWWNKERPIRFIRTRNLYNMYQAKSPVHLEVRVDGYSGRTNKTESEMSSNWN